MSPDPNPDPDIGFPVVGLPTEVTTPDAAVRLLIARLIEAGEVPDDLRDQVEAAIFQREALAGTAIGRGIAIPHARVHGLERLAGRVGLGVVPIPWMAQGGAVLPVRTVCLLVGPRDQPREFLLELERIVRRLRETR